MEMIIELVTIHAVEVGLAVLFVPFVAIQVYAAVKAKQNANMVMNAISLILLVLYMGILMWYSWFVLSAIFFVLWPPEY